MLITPISPVLPPNGNPGIVPPWLRDDEIAKILPVIPDDIVHILPFPWPDTDDEVSLPVEPDDEA